MDKRAKTHGIVYDDGLIVTDQADLPEAVVVSLEQHYYRHQSPELQQNQYYLPQSPEAVPISDKTYYQPPSEYPPTHLDAAGRRSILKRKSTWVVVALVVVLATLGGVLGGVLTSRAKSTPAESANSASTDSKTPSTTSSSARYVFVHISTLSTSSLAKHSEQLPAALQARQSRPFPRQAQLLLPRTHQLLPPPAPQRPRTHRSRRKR